MLTHIERIISLKKLIKIFNVLFFICTLAGCGQGKQDTITVPKNVIEVIIAPYGSEKMTFKYTEAEKVSAFVSYISDLETLSKTKENPELYDGFGVIITLCTSNGKEREYFHYLPFFRQGKDDWYDLPYDKGQDFFTMLREYEPDVPAEKPLFPADDRE